MGPLRRSTWLLMGAGLASALLVAGACWFGSEADLRAALVAGPGGSPPGPPPPPATRAPIDPAFHMLMRLLIAHDLWRRAEALSVQPRPPLAVLARAGAVPPEFADAAHRAVVAAQAAVRSGGGGLELLVPGDPEAWQRAVLLALAERIVRDAPAALPALVADGVVLATLGEPRSARQQQLMLDSADLLVEGVTARLAELRPAQAAPLAASLHGLRDRLWETRASAPAGDFAVLADALRSGHILARLGTADWLDGRRVLQALDDRLERAARLRAARDRWWAYAGAPTPADLPARTAGVEDPGTPFRPPPYQQLLNRLLALDVLLAELDGAGAAAPQAPPVDLYDPGHGRLRPILRAPGPGLPPARIGWYSVGPDGRDDGADAGNDLGFPTTAAALGDRRFSDPPDGALGSWANP